jgi:hypothetical protein
VSVGPAFSVVGYGVDDVTLGFDMTGSGSIARLNELDGTMVRRGKMLGHRASWGQWSHLLGRSVAFWKADTSRLYVQAKLAPEGSLCAPAAVRAGVDELMERMALVGLVSFEEPWVTRLDVAVDADCPPAGGKLLLDALEAVRLPNGWRTTSVGRPRSTVYFKARGTEKVLARAYCRNLKTKEGEPFGRIRLEAEQRFEPKALRLEAATAPIVLGTIWVGRFGDLSSKVTRLAREAQALEIAERVERRELSYTQGERLSMFLDLERLGTARTYYPQSAYADRRRLAARLGYAANEHGQESLEADLSELLAPYRAAVEAGTRVVEAATGREAAAAATAPTGIQGRLGEEDFGF